MTKFIDFNMLTQKEIWINVNLNQSKAGKANLFDVGAKTKLLLLELDQLHTNERVQKTRIEFFNISYFIFAKKKLPLNNEVIKDAPALNPINRNLKNALNGISRLALTFGKMSKTSLPMAFNLKSDSVDDCKLCDIKFALYQTSFK